MRGAQEWANNCARCHNLRAPREFSAAELHNIILHMRLQAGLTGQETRDIYAFLAAQSQKPQALTAASQTENQAPKNLTYAVATVPTTTTKNVSQPLQKISSDPVSQSGQAIYQQNCVACHGSNGKGALPGVPDLATHLTKSDSVLFQHIKNGFQDSGSSMAMPPKGGNSNLSDDDVKQVLAYIKKTF